MALRLLQVALQARPASERAAAGTGSHAQAVLRHAVERHQALRHQRRHATGQHRIEDRAVGHAEIGERVVVHRHPAHEPAIRIMRLAEAIERAGAAHAVQRRVEPERRQNGGIDRRAPRAAFDGPNRAVQRREIQSFHEVPHDPRAMLRRQQPVEIRRAQLQLVAIGPLEARRRGLNGHLSRWLCGRQRKQSVCHGATVANFTDGRATFLHNLIA